MAWLVVQFDADTATQIAPIAVQRRRPRPCSRRLGIEIKLTQQPSNRQPAVALDSQSQVRLAGSVSLPNRNHGSLLHRHIADFSEPTTNFDAFAASL